MKRFAGTCVCLLMAAMIVIAAPTAKASHAEQFDDLLFVEVPGFYTVIEDVSGEEYRFNGILDAFALEQCPEILSIASYHVYYGETAVMDVVLREMEIAATDAELTGAAGSVLTNGYYAVLFDINDEYEAFLTGLTQDNLQEVQEELIAAILEGRDFEMTHLDFIDTEKIEWGEGENKDLCWAAACSNVLHYTGWAQAANAGLNTPDDVFEVFIDAFNPMAGNAAYGFPWFFGGINAKQGVSGWAQVDNTEEYAYSEFDGFLPEYAVDNFMTKHYLSSDASSIENAFAALRCGAGSTISFGWYDSSWSRFSGHAITLWGYVQKKNASGFDKSDYYALIVSDSDSDTGYDERRSAPNILRMMQLTPASANSGYDSWTLHGYNTSSYALLEAFYTLVPYSDAHPAEETVSANKFDGVATDIIPDVAFLSGGMESEVFTSSDSISLRYGVKLAAQFSWTTVRVMTISYTLTDGTGAVLAENSQNTTKRMDIGYRYSWSTTLNNLPAGEYTLTVTVSLQDPSYEETYYSNNTWSRTFTVIDVPELTLSAAVAEDDDKAFTAYLAADEASALAAYDMFELSVSYLQNDVWTPWTTAYAGRTIPTSCAVEMLGTHVKFRLEAECGGVLTQSWESNSVSLEVFRTHVLEDGGDLRALLASNDVQDGDTIVLLGTGHVNDTNSDAAPWVIDKAVTIRGGSIDLRAGGILLGANVTFDGVKLGFANRVRNAIIANGYTLTLNNVTQESHTCDVHLFCGSLTGHSITAPSGTHGKIVIKGSTALGNIYAGSISADGNENSFDLPVSVIVECNATGSMGTFYACGAPETYVDPDEMLNPDFKVAAPVADAGRFVATGTVSLELYQGVIKAVDCATGGRKNACVTFDGDGDLCEITFANLGGLIVRSGHLAPRDSSLVEGADVSIADGARLELIGFGNAVIIRDFVGGGELVLGESQTLTVTGSVSGTTSVGIGGIFNGASEGTIDNERVYIVAANSAEDSFVLLPPQIDTKAVFARDEKGNWTVPPTAVPIIVESASVPESITVESGTYYLEIPVTITYISDLTYSFLGCVPVEIAVDGVAATLCEDEYRYYYYTFPESIGWGDGAFYTVDETTENLTIYNNFSGEIPDGQHTITLTIPGKYMKNGEALVLTTVLTIGEVTDPNVIDSGKCGDNLTWVLTKDGVFTISGEGRMDNWGIVNGSYVTPWAKYAVTILRAEIGNGVTGICDGIFYNCANLAEVTIADGVTHISTHAFYGCESLESITLPGSVEEIWNYAFQNCTGLKSIVIPEQVVEIPDAAFAGCTSLESIILSTETECIGTEAFSGCESLGSITIPGSVWHISENAFAGCTALVTVYYDGTAGEWSNVTIEDGNDALLKAEIVFLREPEHTHTWGEAVYTWSEDSSECTAVRGCASCDESETETAVAEAKTTAPTCTEAGYTEYTAVFVNESFMQQKKTVDGDAALNHDYDDGSVTTEPICEAPGVKTYTCKRTGCGHSYTEEVAKLGHTEETIPGKAATCTEMGLTEGKKCATCGEILVEQEEIPALDHLDENGDHICDRCGERTELLNGLNKDSDGVWRYYEDGEVATDFTGFVKHINGKYYFVDHGVVEKTTGLVLHVNGRWYYIKNGVKTDYTGFVKHSDGNYYYVKEGVKIEGSGFLKHTNGKYYYVQGGMMVATTGLVIHTNGKYYYIVKGVKQDDFTGLVKHTNGKYYYVQKGMMRDDFTGLAKHTNRKFYYVEKGVWTKVTALVPHSNGKLYYVVDGIFDKTYNGKAKTLDGKEYEVVNGIAQP